MVEEGSEGVGAGGMGGAIGVVGEVLVGEFVIVGGFEEDVDGAGFGGVEVVDEAGKLIVGLAVVAGEEGGAERGGGVVESKS